MLKTASIKQFFSKQKKKKKKIHVHENISEI